MMRNEVILLYGIGFKGIVHAISIIKGKEFLFILDEIVIQIGNQKYWLWIVWNQFIELY